MSKKYGIQIKGLGKALRPSGLGVLRPKPTGKGGKLLKPKPIRPGKADGGSAKMPDGSDKPRLQIRVKNSPRKDKELRKEGVQEKKRSAKNRQEYKKKMVKVSPDVKMYLKHGKAFPGFDQSRRIRGGLKDGGRAKFPDLTGDGKVTRADVLKGRGVFGAGGGVRGSTRSSDIYSRIKQRHRLKKIRKNFKKGRK